MKNWNAYLNYLKSLIIHITKAAVIFLILWQSNFAQQDSTNNNTDVLADSGFVMSKSPWGAVIRSAVIPGWGQIYNESYLKAPIIWGIGAWLTFNWVQNNNSYHQYRTLFAENINNTSYKTIRDFYRDQRDMMSIYLGLTYILNLVDAYVDAQLFDFTVEENRVTKMPMLNIRINLLK